MVPQKILNLDIDSFHNKTFGAVHRQASSRNAKSQLTFTCSKSTIETPEKGVKYVQS